MSDTIKLWCFILLIPFLAAIGHDIYANYYKNEENRAKIEAMEIDPSTYQGSDLGYLLVTYTPELYENSKVALGQENWTAWVDPVLQLYTWIVALIPLAVFLTWLLIARIFDIWPYADYSAKNSAPNGRRNDPLDKRSSNTATKFKYKRR